jgi:putative acetyltransferase
MIRAYTEEDQNSVLDVWYQASTLAHPFLEKDFVEKVRTDMRELYLPNAKSWVYIENNLVLGFISMIENEIGGLFVLPGHHSKGIGTKLVNYMQKYHSELEVEVFEANLIGRAFYDKYGFKFLEELKHEETGNQILRLVFKLQN